MTPVVRKCLSVALAAACAGVAVPGPCADGKWTYAGPNGPAKWGKLEKAYEACAEGYAQSPIDIPDAKVRKGDFPSLLFNYKPAALTFEENPRALTAELAPGGYVSLDAATYFLSGITFHRPGEYKVDGKGHEAEAYLVHKTKEGKPAILVVPLRTGKENPAMKAILAAAPAATPKAGTAPGPTINAADLLPSNKDYYAYAGSQTTPPCTENVDWIVLKYPVTISGDQMARLSRLYPANARPVQPINGRDIRASR